MRRPTQTDYALLSIGIALILLPLGFVVSYPNSVNAAFIQLRVLTALGGALVGACIPGLLHVEIPGIRATGALALLVLFWLVNPSQALNDQIAKPDTGEAPSSSRYDERYDYGSGYFAKLGDGWVEQKYADTARFATFKEISRDEQFIYLADANRSIDGRVKTLYVRLPVHGGMSQYSWELAGQWQNNFVVERK